MLVFARRLAPDRSATSVWSIDPAKRSAAGVLALLGVGTAGIVGGILLASILGDDGGNGGAAVPSTVANTPSVEAEQASVPLTAEVSESSVAARALNPLFNASFETSGGWYPNFKRSAVTATVRSVPDARDGDFVLGVSTTEPEGSIAQDVRLGPVDGETITFTVQVRSSQDGAQLAGILAIWLLAAGDAPQQPASGLSEFTRFTASSDWETVTYSITAQEHHPEGIVRAEVYLQTEGVELFVDDARLSVG